MLGVITGIGLFTRELLDDNPSAVDHDQVKSVSPPT